MVLVAGVVVDLLVVEEEFARCCCCCCWVVVDFVLFTKVAIEIVLLGVVAAVVIICGRFSFGNALFTVDVSDTKAVAVVTFSNCCCDELVEI